MNEKNPLAKQLSVAGLAMVLYAAASFTGNFLFLGVPSGFEYSPMYGRLTYTDGEPLDHEEVRLTFYPLEIPSRANLSPRAGITVLNKDGTFDAITSLDAGDGLLQANYRVTITTPVGDALPLSVISREYAVFDRSPLEVRAEASPLLLKVPRPEVNQPPHQTGR